MPKGHADWNIPGISGAISQVGDLGELAVRLGSPDSFERSGNVLYIENFERGFTGWNITPVGANAGAWLSTLAARTGGCCVALFPGTTATYKVQIEKAIPYPWLSKLGMEISVVAHSDLTYLQFGLSIYDGTNYCRYFLQHNWQTDVLSYLETGVPWTSFVDPLVLSPQDYLFHTFKLVIDPENKLFSRILIDDVGYDMTTIPAVEAASATSPHMRLLVYAEQGSGKTAYLLLDDVIITQNEPEGI